MKNAGVCLYFL